MKSSHRKSLLIAAAGLLLAACGSKATPVTPATGTGVQDDFSSASCLFGSMQAGTSRGYECIDGEFRAWIDNDQDAYEFVTAPTNESYGDVRIEVDVRFVSGEEAGAYLLCRGSQLSGNFYYFRLGADGLAEITDYLEGEEQIARMYPLPEGTIQPGWNHLRADCIGMDLALYLNGELVLERAIEGSVYETGDIGLGAGGGSLGFSEVRFDNLVVTRP
jgi:ABC-type glycerol-3-phosphate transport system substrate-binding protein